MVWLLVLLWAWPKPCAGGVDLPLLAKPVNLACRPGKLSRPSDISLPSWSLSERNRSRGGWARPGSASCLQRKGHWAGGTCGYSLSNQLLQSDHKHIITVHRCMESADQGAPWGETPTSAYLLARPTFTHAKLRVRNLFLGRFLPLSFLYDSVTPSSHTPR